MELHRLIKDVDNVKLGTRLHKMNGMGKTGLDPDAAKEGYLAKLYITFAKKEDVD